MTTSTILSTRTLNCLRNAEIMKSEDREPLAENLIKFSAKDLMDIPNMGRKSIIEIEQWLAERGFKLQPRVCPCCGQIVPSKKLLGR